MNIEKIVGYIYVAITTFIVAIFFENLLATFGVAVFGFYCVSGAHKKD